MMRMTVPVHILLHSHLACHYWRYGIRNCKGMVFKPTSGKSTTSFKSYWVAHTR